MQAGILRQGILASMSQSQRGCLMPWGLLVQLPLPSIQSFYQSCRSETRSFSNQFQDCLLSCSLGMLYVLQRAMLVAQLVARNQQTCIACAPLTGMVERASQQNLSCLTRCVSVCGCESWQSRSVWQLLLMLFASASADSLSCMVLLYQNVLT